MRTKATLQQSSTNRCSGCSAKPSNCCCFLETKVTSCVVLNHSQQTQKRPQSPEVFVRLELNLQLARLKGVFEPLFVAEFCEGLF